MEKGLAEQDKDVLALIRVGLTFAEAFAALGIGRGSRYRIYQRLVRCGRQQMPSREEPDPAAGGDKPLRYGSNGSRVDHVALRLCIHRMRSTSHNVFGVSRQTETLDSGELNQSTGTSAIA